MSEYDYGAAYKLDVSGMTEQKNGMTYLSWTHAVRLLMQSDPSASWHLERQSDGRFYHSDESGSYVVVHLETRGQSYQHVFPVLDHRNKPLMKPDAMAVNKAQMRGVTKLIAMVTGYGLHVYAGEDMPADLPASEEERRKEAEAAEAKKTEAKRARVRKLAATMDDAGLSYDSLSSWSKSKGWGSPSEFSNANAAKLLRDLGFMLTDGIWRHDKRTPLFVELADFHSELKGDNQ